ncbi:hypothetical protein ACFLSG_03550 [Candidatus Bipolaricaulota bacterium]
MKKIGGDSGNVILVIPLPFLGAGVQIKLTSRTAVRLLLLIGVIASFSAYTWISYSGLFPSDFHMEVFFDKAGIDNALEIFTDRELAALGYDRESSDLQYEYFVECDKTIEEGYGGTLSQFFTLPGATIRSQGSSEFNVDKVSGFQKYHIASSPGNLAHVLERPGEPELHFWSVFEKQPTAHDYVSPSLITLLSGSLVLQPRFKQYLAMVPGVPILEYAHVLVAAIKMRFLPTPVLYNTVYFAVFEIEDVQSMVPVAYTAYKY